MRFLSVIGSAQYDESARSFLVRDAFEYGSYLREMPHQVPNGRHFQFPNALAQMYRMFAHYWISLKCNSAALWLFLHSDYVLPRPSPLFGDHTTDLSFGVS